MHTGRYETRWELNSAGQYSPYQRFVPRSEDEAMERLRVHVVQFLDDNLGEAKKKHILCIFTGTVIVGGFCFAVGLPILASLSIVLGVGSVGHLLSVEKY